MAVLAVLSEPVSPLAKSGKCRVILPNCRDGAVLSKQKALASQLGWIGLEHHHSTARKVDSVVSAAKVLVKRRFTKLMATSAMALSELIKLLERALRRHSIDDVVLGGNQSIG